LEREHLKKQKQEDVQNMEEKSRGTGWNIQESGIEEH